MFSDRIQKLKEKIKKENFDAVLISSYASIVYLTGYTNFSKDEREAYLLIGKNFQYIVTDGRYSEAIKKEVSHLTFYERGQGRSTEDLLKKHNKEIKVLGIEEDNMTVSEHKTIKKHVRNIKHFNIGEQRNIKTDEEIDKIKKACRIGDEAFDFIVKQLKIGITEKEIARALEKFIKAREEEFSFPPIVAFGENSSVPHHQTGNTKLKKGDFVLLDFGVKLESYCSDMTRTLFFGNPSIEQKEIYHVVKKAQQNAVEFINRQIKSGKEIIAHKVDEIARDYIIKKGYPSIPHSLGHGIGLEVHEYPYLSIKSKDILKVGMVFSIEPGIYLENFGGVRIEDLFVIEKNKLRQLTNASLLPTLPSS